jgi:hypothetical protein
MLLRKGIGIMRFYFPTAHPPPEGVDFAWQKTGEGNPFLKMNLEFVLNEKRDEMSRPT